MQTRSLNTRRQSLGLTYSRLASATGLSERSVYRLMADNTLPQSLCARQTLAAALKVDLDGLAALAAAKPRGALGGIRRGGSARRAHAPKRTSVRP